MNLSVPPIISLLGVTLCLALPQQPAAMSQSDRGGAGFRSLALISSCRVKRGLISLKYFDFQRWVRPELVLQAARFDFLLLN